MCGTEVNLVSLHSSMKANFLVLFCFWTTPDSAQGLFLPLCFISFLAMLKDSIW